MGRGPVKANGPFDLPATGVDLQDTERLGTRENGKNGEQAPGFGSQRMSSDDQGDGMGTLWQPDLTP